MKKGFTLVELLAVIVILAIVLVIAVPQIGKVVKKTRINAIGSTTKLIAAKAEEKELENEVVENPEDLLCENLVKLDENYGSCVVNIVDGKKVVTLSGSDTGKFAGITCIGTKENVVCNDGNEITLTVDLNGGSTTQNFEPTYMDGSKIELIEPTREGYSFAGWEVIIGDSTIEENVLTIGKENTTIYALWESNPTLTVELNGGISNQTFAERYKSGTVIQLIPPTKERHVFSNFEVVEGNGTISGNTYTHGTEDTVLRANYIEITASTLSYDNTKTNVECYDVQCMIDYLSYMLRGE